MGGKSVRLEDVARLAGVSIATASRALNNSSAVSQATRQRVWAIAREQNYILRPNMPVTAAEATAVISIAVPLPLVGNGRLLDPFFMELISAIGDAAREAGCDLRLSQLVPQTYDDLLSLLNTSRKGGTIFLGQSTLHDYLNQLAREDHRFVVWGAELPQQRYGSVGSDNRRGGRLATAHLLRLGRRRVAFIGNTDAPEAMLRFLGYREALEDAGIGYDAALFARTYFDVGAAEAEIDAMFERQSRFDAVVAASDLIALGVMRALSRRGVSVPEDVAVTGYDDLYVAAISRPALTTVRQDLVQAGRLLVAKLLSGASAAHVRPERLSTDLIIRESCGA